MEECGNMLNLYSYWFSRCGYSTCIKTLYGLVLVEKSIATWVGTKITNGLKFDLYNKLFTFETSFYDNRNSGNVIFNFNNMAYMA